MRKAHQPADLCCPVPGRPARFGDQCNHAIAEDPAGALLYYGDLKPGMESISVFSGTAFGNRYSPARPEVNRIGDQVYLYPAPEGFALPFDIFSALFYLLSRYEEYLPFTPDEHGRFEASQSLAWRQGFLQQPVVDQWVKRFGELLTEHFPDLPIRKQEFRCLSTIDVDAPWAFRHKGIFRSMAILDKTFHTILLQEFIKALRVMTGMEAGSVRYI